jgi:hypothetical protein
MAKLKLEVNIETAPYDNTVKGRTYMATAEVKVLESDKPVLNKTFRAGPHEATRETEAISWAVAWAMDKLYFNT